MSSRFEELADTIRQADTHNRKDNSSDILIKSETGEDIIAKTELTDKQITAVTKLKVLAEVTGNTVVDTIVNTFCNAQISRERKSRHEFIKNNQSIRTHEEMKKDDGSFERWFGEK